MAITILPRFNSQTPFYQPQLTRYHHPFRAPMNSAKLNLANQQFRFDVQKLYARAANLSRMIPSLLKAVVSTTSANTAVVLGYIEAVEYGNAYDIDENGALNTTNPVTSSFSYTTSASVTTQLSTLLDSGISLESLNTKLQRISDRITILEKRLWL